MHHLRDQVSPAGLKTGATQAEHQLNKGRTDTPRATRQTVGSTTVIVVPAPGSLTASIVPPCVSIT